MISENLKNFISFVFTENCYQYGEEGCGCTLMNCEKMLHNCNEKCPFTSSYIRIKNDTVKIADPEIICNEKEIFSCNEVTIEHWKEWINKYQSIIE